MSPEVLDTLEGLAAAGLELAVDGDRILYRPVAAMTPELAAAVGACKPDLLALLAGSGPGWSAAELLVLAGADLSPAEVPAITAAKAAFAGLCGLTLVGFEPHAKADSPEHLSDAWRELYEERAAIMEYDGNLPREVAEALALADMVAWMSDVNGTRRTRSSGGGA